LVQSAIRLQGLAAGALAAPEPARPGAIVAPRPLTAVDLLAAGGDQRIALDETTGLNRYGCQPYPDPDALAFGSSTASVISVPAFASVERLTGRLSEALAGGADAAALYAEDIGRARRELLDLLGLADMAGLRAVISRSGTDLHHIVAQLIGAGVGAPPLVIASEGGETGSGVGAALGGLASAGAALRAHAAGLPPFGAAWPCQVMQVPARAPDGAVRPAEQVDEEVAGAARAAASIGRRVLLILMDSSKTGLISPSVDCALALKRRFPDQIDVLVDACQMRLAPPTLRAYLAADCLVAITGSKFMTGPTFSAALLAPDGAVQRLGASGLPPALGAHCARADWPSDWPDAETLPARANFGLLARWQAALEEMRPFLALDPAHVHAFLDAMATAVGDHLDADPRFERVTQRPLDRAALGVGGGWDVVQTIHPFVLTDGARPLSAEDTLGLYRLTAMNLGGWARAVGEADAVQHAAGLRVQLGQPVACGQRGGRPISALRLCASARVATAALAPGGLGVPAVIDQALAALDKTAWLARRMTSFG
jgi:hypothetical protein